MINWLVIERIWYLGCLLVSACASQVAPPQTAQIKEAAPLEFRPASVEIIYERGHNSHRFFLVNEISNPQVLVYHDSQLFKNFKLKAERFNDLLNKSVEAMDSLQRKPAKKENTPCRTPFVMTLKNPEKTHTVEGCRASEEGAIIGKLIAEIEYMISSDVK